MGVKLLIWQPWTALWSIAIGAAAVVTNWPIVLRRTSYMLGLHIGILPVKKFFTS